MIVLGLTGPTGAGKGEVSARLAAKGLLVVDTDRLAREVVAPQSPCLSALCDAFGKDILNEDGTLDRAALAKKAFASKEAQQTLGAITHPAIIERSLDILNGSTAFGAVIDAPLLFESGMHTLCDTTAAVLAPAALRLERICIRDGLDKERALARMNAQPDEAFYRERAAHILVNDGDLAALERQVEALANAVWEGLL